MFSVKIFQKIVLSCHNTTCHTQQERARIVQNTNNLHNLCTHIEVIKEKLFLEDIPETKGSYELADQFQEDKMFENFDGQNDKKLLERVIVLIYFFLV